ncbi:MAG TPA: starch synthase, partial [Firmicutes bacterium]|nr:starch synthase [Bacillota bacterium]
MKILFASSEVSPFAKTGGLADVSYSLPKALKRQGNDVSVITPLYRTTIDKGYEFENIIDLKVDHLGKTVTV